MATVHMLIGIPGCGKTTFAKQLQKEINCEIVSTDIVRTLHNDWQEEAIWPEVYRLSYTILKSNKDMIFDATNITPKVRKRFIDNVKEYEVNFDVGAYYFTTPVNECIKRVNIRNDLPNERYLPIDVISSYGEKLIIPTIEEGFVFIKHIK